MPKLGGSSTTAGVDFEAWFIASLLSEAFFDENISVRPQASTYTDPKTKEVNLAAIDDVCVTRNFQEERYNLKYRAPKAKVWDNACLKNQRVLIDFKDQFLQSPNLIQYFVTQSPCPLFSDIFPTVSGVSDPQELKLILSDDNFSEWEKTREILELSDEQFIRFAKQVKYKSIIDSEEIKKNIICRFQYHVTNYQSVPDCLHTFAMEIAILGKEVRKDDIIHYLQRNDIHPKAHLSPQLLLNQIHTPSNDLLNIPHTFFRDCHLERQEVEKLWNWIQGDPGKPPIIFLLGNAGCGKTVILRNLLVKLQEQKIPTFAIKSDLYAHESLAKLTQEIGLKESIHETLASIVEQYGISVVLIDQIDALSQHLSSDRRIINTYVSLINRLCSITNLRIIVSCRIFDFRYDPVLRALGENRSNIEVQNLTEEQVKVILSKFGISTNIPPKLIDLLKTPQHLKIFCELDNKSLSVKELRTLQALYDKLWDQKISARSDAINTIEYLVGEMSQSKCLTIPFALLDKHNEAREYLLSQNLLIRQKNKLQFFHQSFFDYCYARKFVSSKKSLTEVIQSEHQGLFIRPQVQQVLCYSP